MPARRADARWGTVLVADDDPDIRAALHLLLTNAGFDVLLARDGREALQLFGTSVPRLIVLDLMMPGIDGWDFLSRTEPTMPVIVISGAGTLAQRPLHGNVVKVISKPFGIAPFLAAVEKYAKYARAAPGH